MLFREIAEGVSDHFGDEDPNIVYYGVGGLFFLRFVVPSIFSPQMYGLAGITLYLF